MPDINATVFEETKRSQDVTQVDIYSTNTALNEYQVGVDIITQFGGYTLDKNALPNWRESSSKIWSKMNLPAKEGKRIMILDVDANDGDATFIFFDNFPGNSLDITKWEEIGTVTDIVAGGILTITSDGYDAGHTLLWHSDYGSITDIVIESRNKVSLYPSVLWETSIFARATDPSVTKDMYILVGYSAAGYIGDISKFVLGVYSTIANQVGATHDTNFHVYKFVLAGTSIKSYQDNILVASTIDASHNNGRIGIGNTGGTRSGVYDWIFVRKYTSPEPIVLMKQYKNLSHIIKFIGKAG